MTATKKKPVSCKAVLRKLGACQDAIKWVGNRTAQAAWDECENPEWMFWLLERTMPAKVSLTVRRRIVRLACDVARPALAYVPKGEDRPRVAIETAERWAKGEKVTTDELAAARAAARAALDAAGAAARAAARAAAMAAWDAAGAAARAAAMAAGDAAKKEQCRLIRKWFPKPPAVREE